MHFSPSNFDTQPRSYFVGIQQALCFSPSWLHQSCKGYASIGAKELTKAGTAPVHRIVAMLLLSQLSAGDCVLHRCGNRKCHNPYHLYIGGDAENQRDAKLHSTSSQRWGYFENVQCGNHSVLMQQPLVLSTETCRRSSKFQGFTPSRCFHVDWLAETSDGYPQLPGYQQLSGDIAGAHRKIYELFCGPIDKYDIVGHQCGDATCLNPYHLTITGRADIGEWNLKYDKRFKLTPTDQAKIASSRATAVQLAKELGVHHQTITSYRLMARR